MTLDYRNYPPVHGIRVPRDVLERFVVAILQAAEMDLEGATLVANHLVSCDARCVFSHGTTALAAYFPLLRDGRVNPKPGVRVAREDGATAVLDGDGGLGYHACAVGMALAVSLAGDYGVGAVTTFNHNHFGAAGIWTRLAIKEGCVGMAVSSHRFLPDREEVVARAAGRSPMSIAVPMGDQPPLVLDMGAVLLPRTEDLMAQFPHAFFKALGIGAVNAVLGGILAGVWKPEVMAPASAWDANQGSFLTAWDVSRFMDLDTFKKEVDAYVSRAMQMRPFPGMERAELPGGMEHRWEQENARVGIPLGQDHLDLLSGVAADAGVATPWDAFEDTRF